MAKSSQHLFGTTALSLILAMGAAQGTSWADSLPAVSTTNGKFAVEGGIADDEFSGFLTGSLSVPLDHSYGMQIDGLFGRMNGEPVVGAALHLFWRDPDEALVGVYAQWTHQEFNYLYTPPGVIAVVPPFLVVDKIDRGRVGGEAELYLDRISLEGIAGVEFGNGQSSTFFSMEDLRYYATDNLAFSIGHRYLSRQHQGVATVEYQVDGVGVGSGLTLFADGRVGENSFESARAGVRVYFGAEPKSLIRRHREDDPHGKLPAGLTGEDACNPTFESMGVGMIEQNAIMADFAGSYQIGCGVNIEPAT